MAGSPNNMRVSWQFYELTLSSPATFESTNFREFSFDQKYFDHFNLGPSAVRVAFFMSLWCN